MKRYTKMEYENPDEMTFGFSKHPVKTKNGIKDFLIEHFAPVREYMEE